MKVFFNVLPYSQAENHRRKCNFNFLRIRRVNLYLPVGKINMVGKRCYSMFSKKGGPSEHMPVPAPLLPRILENFPSQSNEALVPQASQHW